MTATAAIVLAAGPSRRTGAPKQLVDLDGRPVLDRVVSAVTTWPVDTVVVVLGAYADQILDAIDLKDVTVAINDDWEEGIASSLRVGLDVLTRDSKLEKAFIARGNQPGIPIGVPSQLAAASDATGKRATIPIYRYERGSPTLIDRALWPRLMTLTGNADDRALLITHPEWVDEVRFSELSPRTIESLEDVPDLRTLHHDAGSEAS